MELLKDLTQRGTVVGVDLSGITAFLAAQVLLNFLGYISAERGIS
jgi:agmatinase